MEATPPGFVFAVKANMRITHILRLKNAGEATELFFRMIDPLRTSRRLGPVLFQLPPAMKCDVALLQRVPRTAARRACGTPSNSGTRRGWWRRCTTRCGERNISLCVAESEKLEVPEVITADFVYYRLRKPDYTAERHRRDSPRARRNCWRPGAICT